MIRLFIGLDADFLKKFQSGCNFLLNIASNEVKTVNHPPSGQRQRWIYITDIQLIYDYGINRKRSTISDDCQ